MRTRCYTVELGCWAYEKFLNASASLMAFAERINDPADHEYRAIWMAPMVTTVLVPPSLAIIMFADPLYVRVLALILMLALGLASVLVKLWTVRYFQSRKDLEMLVKSLDETSETK